MTYPDQTIHVGRGVAQELVQILRGRKPNCIFLVTGQGSYALSGAEAALAPKIEPYRTVRFSDFGANLKLEEIVAGANLFRESKCDYVIGVGGGSVIDLAKAVSILGVQPGDPAGYVTEQKPPVVPRVETTMIPTTAGTGSESTHFSVIYVGGVKQSLSHPSMLPDFALVDPNLTDSLPPEVTACSGLDALCQAIESFWSNRSTEASRKLSAEAIRIIMANLDRAVNAPTPETRDQMLTAANLSGQAINIARTTAAHAASYPLTSAFGITHGHAVGLILLNLFEMNAAVTEDSLQDERGLAFVQNTIAELLDLLGVASAAEAGTILAQLMGKINLSANLSDLGVSRDQLDSIAQHGINSARAVNNPRHIGREDLQRLYRAIL